MMFFKNMGVFFFSFKTKIVIVGIYVIVVLVYGGGLVSLDVYRKIIFVEGFCEVMDEIVVVSGLVFYLYFLFF